MKVLFAVNNEEISESIIKRYQRDYKEIISSKNVYYYNAIIKELQKDKSYDRIVIGEDLEPFSSDDYSNIDKFLFDKLDKISDEAYNSVGNDIPIILICTDRRTRPEPLLVKLFGISVYNALIGQDRSIDEVCRLIKKPRSKKEAKSYYRIDSEKVSYKPESESDVSETEIQNILAHYKKLGKDEKKIVASFDSIASQYNENQLKLIINFLPKSVSNVLEEKSANYRQLIGLDPNLVKKPEKTNKNTGKQSIDVLDKRTNKSRLASPVIIPDTVNTQKVKKVIQKKQIEENNNRIQLEDEILNSYEDDIEKTKVKGKPIKKDETVDSLLQEIEKPVKRGRGRPPKSKQEEAVTATKRGRGRPSKEKNNYDDILSNYNEKDNDLEEVEDEDDLTSYNNLENKEKYEDINEELNMLPEYDEQDDFEDENSLPGYEEEDEDENSLPGYEDEDEEDENSLPGYEDEDEDDEEDENSLPGYEEDDEEDENSLPGYEDEDEEDENSLPGYEEDDEDDENSLPGYEEDDEDDENSLPGYEDEDEDDENSLPGYEDEDEDDDSLPGYEEDDDDEYEIQGIDDDTSDLGDGIQNVNFNNNNNDNINNSIQNRNFANSNININIDNLLTSDKKIVSFVGTSKNGTSFLINNLAKILSEKGIKTAILDLTQNRNAYYVYTDNRDDLRNIAIESIKKLNEGIANGIEVNKNLTVYTSLPDDKEELDNAQNIIKTLLNNYSLILLDCDFMTNTTYFNISQEIYLVQSLDVLTIQPLTAFLRELKAKNILDQNKLRVVINKYIKSQITDKMLIGGLSSYNDPSMSYMTELFNKENMKYVTVPFEIQNYSIYLDSLVNCKITLKGYSKNLLRSLEELGNMVFPLLGSGKIKSSYGNYNSNFSKDTNNTLNKMKNKF